MTHLKKYWLWYAIAIVVVVAAILAYSNWETVKGWFSSSSDSSGNNSDRVTEELSSSNQRNAGNQPVAYNQCEGENVWSWGTNPTNSVEVRVRVHSTDCKSNETYAAKQFLSSGIVSSVSTNNCKVNYNKAIAFQKSIDQQLTSKFPNLHFTYLLSAPSFCV